MPATVNGNKLTIVHASSTGIATMFPDVCKTPSPAGPVPIPYPNVAQSSDTADGSSTVKVDGNPIMLKSSNYRMSTGDEAGAAMGVASNKIKGKAEPILYSFDVKVDGGNVFRLTDMMLQNCGSPANTPPGTNVQPPVVIVDVSQECKNVEEKYKEQAGKGTSWGECGIIDEHRPVIQEVADQEHVEIYFRKTKGICGKWIKTKHMPKPHSCLKGTTITPAHLPAVQVFLDSVKSGSADPMSTNQKYDRFASAYLGIIGIPEREDAKGNAVVIRPEKGSGRGVHSGRSYKPKWMTGDYDLFQVLYKGEKCKPVIDGEDKWNEIQRLINTRLEWDAIQHGPQAQWSPTPDELAPGVELFKMPELVSAIAKKTPGATTEVTFDPRRKKMQVIDSPLTVVAGKGNVVTLDGPQDVVDSLRCKGCGE